MPNLDDLVALRSADPQQMGDRIAELPDQVQAAWNLARKVPLPDSHRQATSIVAIGMGGSAVGADVVRGVTQADLKVPFTVWRDYGLPGFVGPETLVLALSHSGNTEETLSGFRAALDRGAKLVAITSGGALGELARQHGVPLIQFQYASQPRAALGYLFSLPLAVLVRLGYLDDLTAEVDRTIKLLGCLRSTYGPDVPTSQNAAKRLAQRLHGRLAVIYGGGPYAVVAQRWKNQLNENSKSWGLFEALSELNHNAVVGFEHPAELRRLLQVILIGTAASPPRIQRRAQITAQLLDRLGISHTMVEGEGESDLERVMSSIYLGDYASYYLAMLNRVDPTQIEAINVLKEALSRS